MSLFLALSTALACACFPPQHSNWTVDDDEPADFTSIAAAIQQASDGDVILVHPGAYAGFTLRKDLAILGAANGSMPQVDGACGVEDVNRFTLAGLQFRDRLTISNIYEQGHLDECILSTTGYWYMPLLEITACNRLLMSRTTVTGKNGLDYYGQTAVVKITSSTVAVVGGAMQGGGGAQNSDSDGQGAVRVLSSTVSLSGCDLGAGSGTTDGLFQCSGGVGGDAVYSKDSLVVIRGNSATQVKYGQGGGLCSPVSGKHIVAENSTVVYSGVSFYFPAKIENVNGTSQIISAAPAEPYLEISGSDAPGEARRLMLYGPPGAHSIVVSSFQSAGLSLPGLEGLIWLDPASIFQVFPLVTNGQDSAATFLWLLPPTLGGLEGATLYVQAAFPSLPGTLDPTAFMLTNPSDIVLRYEYVPDCNSNGVPDSVDIATGTSSDCNANWIPDECETDCNGNGVPDECDLAGGTSQDCNQTGVPDECEADCNGNGLHDSCDIESGASTDLNLNGIPDECVQDGDCNGNGISDVLDVQGGSSSDCNGTLVPDECEVATAVSGDSPGLAPVTDGVFLYFTLDPAPLASGSVVITVEAVSDLDAPEERILVYMQSPSGTGLVGTLFDQPGEGSHCPGTPDLDSIVLSASTFNFFVATAAGKANFYLYPSNGVVAAECPQPSVATVHVAYVSSEDCNGNDVPDECDLADGTSTDCNANGIPDTCETSGPGDCNGNGVPDVCDLLAGTSQDCNANLLLDECDIASGLSSDCNANGVPDDCETDCNDNHVLDACDIASGYSTDCNANSVPDECEPSDCNNNGYHDACDVSSGSSPDVDGNGVPDECPTAFLVPSHEYPTIQSAIDAAAYIGVATITLADGTYTGADNLELDFLGKNIVLQSQNGPSNCIIDGQDIQRALYLHSGETSATQIVGVTFAYCFHVSAGGAIRCEDSSPVIRGCRFISNFSYAGGAALYYQGGSPQVIDCEFYLNQSDRGAAIYGQGGSLSLENSILAGNHSFYFGAAMFLSGGQVSVANSILADNTVSPGSGSSWTQGGGIYAGSVTLTLRNCTLAGNGNPTHGGGLFLTYDTVATVANSILWNNDAGFGDQISMVNSTLLVLSSNVQGGAAAVHYSSADSTLGWDASNIELPPLFLDPSQSDYHLMFGSPCLDAGDLSLVASSLEKDIDGELRVSGISVEMGADEYHDCNGNWMPDHLDLAGGASADANQNKIPDECE